MRELLESGWDWDYVMNISESDFPVRPIEEFEEHLRRWNGGNFVAMGKGDILKFHDGQVHTKFEEMKMTRIFGKGMRDTFYNCDEHMYRIGQR